MIGYLHLCMKCKIFYSKNQILNNSCVEGHNTCTNIYKQGLGFCDFVWKWNFCNLFFLWHDNRNKTFDIQRWHNLAETDYFLCDSCNSRQKKSLGVATSEEKEEYHRGWLLGHYFSYQLNKCRTLQPYINLFMTFRKFLFTCKRVNLYRICFNCTCDLDDSTCKRFL